MIRRLLFIGLISIILTSCSSRFAYNNLDWLIHWYLDDYVDLTRQQKTLFDDEMAAWLQWHRKEELVKYRDQLTQLKSLIDQPKTSEQDWRLQFELGREHWQRLTARIAPELLPLASQLSTEQIDDIFQAIESEQLEMEEDRGETSPQERKRKQLKRTLKNVRDWTGRLSNSQKQLIELHYDEFRSSFDEWLIYRRKVQRISQSLLHTIQSDPTAEPQLLALFLDPQRHQHDAYREIIKHNQQVFARLMVTLHASLSDKQRLRLHAELDDFIEDISTLMAS